MSNAVTAEELDSMMGGTASSIEVSKPKKQKSKKIEGSLTAEELDKLSEEYAAPDPFNKPTKVASFESQEAAAKFVKDMSILGAQGATQGFGEELLAGAKTGSFSSPEYVTERDVLREELAKKRQEYPIGAPVMEAIGSTATTMAAPVLRGAPLAKDLIAAGIQGAGEAPEMSDIPGEAAKSAAIQGVMEGVGGIAKTVMADDPTKILTRSIGVKGRDLKGNVEAPAVQAVERLNKAGFFKQGDSFIPKGQHKFKRYTNTLEGFFQPQGIDSLYNRADSAISELKARNAQLLKDKKIPSIEVQRGFYEGLQELTYDPLGWNVEGKIDLAREVKDIFEKDLKLKTGWQSGKPVPALDLENAKRSMDAYLKGPAFEKKAIDLGIDKQALMKFRTKMDDILDVQKVGGIEYKKNNDMISDLITVRDIIESKQAADYTDAGSRLIDNRGWYQKALEAVSPTPVDIARSDVAGALETAPGQFVAKTIKRTPVEAFTGNRSPQGGMDPMELAKTRLPRTTEGLIQNKRLVISKLALNGIPPMMLETITQALNEDPDAVEKLAPMIISQFPNLFEKSKYNMFDKKILDPNERSKAADDTSKRDDLNSLQKAKIINELNKTGKWLGE